MTMVKVQKYTGIGDTLNFNRVYEKKFASSITLWVSGFYLVEKEPVSDNRTAINVSQICQWNDAKFSTLGQVTNGKIVPYR